MQCAKRTGVPAAWGEESSLEAALWDGQSAQRGAQGKSPEEEAIHSKGR